MICPRCATENPPEARFCLACGVDLAAAPSPAARRERKLVSVLFCDLVGHTARSEREDPEDVMERLGRYHAATRRVIEAFGGTVEKFIGDAVMAVFGAPVAHEDDPERAVRAGLGILDAIDDLAAAGLELRVRVGVGTGEALVLLDARPGSGEGMLAGDVVNTAARLQAAAPEGAVVVSEETFRQTRETFAWQRLEPMVAKGKEAPVAAHRALAARVRIGDRPTVAQPTPFVGRAVERSLFAGLLERTVRERLPGLVTLVGEPGVGKSRLLAEVRAELAARGVEVVWRRGRCLPYGDGITFWALAELVKDHAGILETDDAEASAAKLDAALSDGDDRPWLRAQLLSLLGVGPGHAADEAFAAWRRFFESVAEASPTVLVVEDLHWADDALLRFLAHLLEWVDGVPLLVVCTARPDLHERAPGWAGGLPNAHTLTLGPLSAAESAELAAALLAAAPEVAAAQAEIAERAGGNPLHAEVIVRFLAERGGATADGLPGTLQALLAARLDVLDPAHKAVLQDAAVVGRVFWPGPWRPWAAATARRQRRRSTTSGGARSSGACACRASRARPSTRSRTRSCATSRTRRSRARSARAGTSRRRRGSTGWPPIGARASPSSSRTTAAAPSSSIARRAGSRRRRRSSRRAARSRSPPPTRSASTSRARRRGSPRRLRSRRRTIQNGPSSSCAGRLPPTGCAGTPTRSARPRKPWRHGGRAATPTASRGR